MKDNLSPVNRVLSVIALSLFGTVPIMWSIRDRLAIIHCTSIISIFQENSYPADAVYTIKRNIVIIVLLNIFIIAMFWPSRRNT